jgi:hypothetical protein
LLVWTGILAACSSSAGNAGDAGRASAVGPCDCPSGAIDSGRDASDASDSGDSSDASPARLGAACSHDSDCPAGASCLSTSGEALFGGAAPSGVCVAPCDARSACSSYAGAVCVDVADPTANPDASPAQGTCFETCTVGDTSPSKCHGAPHVACAPLEGGAAGAGYCRPVCATGADCASGACDPRRGVCVATAPPDTTFGLSCDVRGGDGGSDASSGPDAATATPACDALCVTLGARVSLCSRRCVYGSAGECGPASGGLRLGGCLFPVQGGTVGDLGYCGELCDCNGDCRDPAFVCDAFDDANLQRAFGRAGVCTPPDLVIHGAIPCGG